jgi:uncharacterized membrane protein YpjA
MFSGVFMWFIRALALLLALELGLFAVSFLLVEANKDQATLAFIGGILVLGISFVLSIVGVIVDTVVRRREGAKTHCK